MRPTDNQLARLPKWAEQEIRRLRRQLDDTQVQAHLLDEPGDTPVTWRDLGDQPPQRHGLHPHSVIEFVFARDDKGYRTAWADVAFTFDDGKRYIRVMASQGLVILPQVTNCILIRPDDED